MAKRKGGGTINLVTALLKPVIDEHGFSIWDIRFEKEGPDWFLRVLIDPIDGDMDMEACEKLARAINPIIDEADPIEESYYLEVGSPGIGRKLTQPVHFEQLQGEEVLVHLIRTQEGMRDVVGILKGKTEQTVTVQVEDQDMEFDMPSISYIKLNDDANLF